MYKPLFRIFHILSINRIMRFCNLFMDDRYIKVSSRSRLFNFGVEFSIENLNKKKGRKEGRKK